MTTAQAAAELGVSARTVARWADAGQLEHRKLPSGHRRIPRSALEALRASA